MRMFVTRRKGAIIRTTVVGQAQTTRASKSRTKKAAERAAIQNPKRTNLTKSEWQRRGDAIRSVKRVVPTAYMDGCSLADAEAIHRSTVRLQHLVACAA